MLSGVLSNPLSPSGFVGDLIKYYPIVWSLGGGASVEMQNGP